MTGKELKTLRRKSGLTQKELAEKAGVNQSDISSWERTRRELRLEHNRRLEAVFAEVIK